MYENVASDRNSQFYKAFIHVLLSSVKSVRTVALEEVKSLVSNEKRALVARYLVLKLNEVLDEGKIFMVKEKSPPEEKSDVTGKMILDCVQALCSFRGKSNSHFYPDVVIFLISLFFNRDFQYYYI